MANIESHIKSVLNFEQEDGKVEPISSPRSLEACLRSGYDPSELMPRTIRAFVVKGESIELTEIRHNFFERRRKEKIKKVKEERHVIIDFQTQGEHDLPTLLKAGGGGLGGPTAVGADAEAEAKRIKAEIMENERKRGAANAARQEKELQKIVSNEQRMVDLQRKMLKVVEADEKRRADHEKKVAELRVAAAARRQIKEMEKLEREKKDDEDRKEMEKQTLMFEKKRREAERAMEVKRLADVVAKEKQRRILKVQHHQAILAAIQVREEQDKRREKIMAEREARVQAQLEEKRAAKAAEVAVQRAVAEQRIQDVIEKKKILQQEAKHLYDMKITEVEKRKKEKAEQEELLIRKRLEEQQKLDETRAKRLEASYQGRANRRKAIVARRREKDKLYGQICAERRKEQAMKKLHHDLIMEDKRQSIQRLRRVEEFVRLRTLLKIEEETERAERIKADREFLVEQRIAAMNLAMKKKYQIKEAMEKVKTTNKFHALQALLDNIGNKGRRKSAETAETEPGLGSIQPTA